jgi:hypothetical protein
MALLSPGIDPNMLTPEEIRSLMQSYGGGTLDPEFDVDPTTPGIGEGGETISQDRLNKLFQLSSQKFGAKGGIWGRSSKGLSLEPWKLEAMRQGLDTSRVDSSFINRSPAGGMRADDSGADPYQIGGEAPGQFQFNLDKFADPNVRGSRTAINFGKEAISDQVMGGHTDILGGKVGLPALGVAGTALGYGVSPGAALGYGLKGLTASAANPSTMAIIAAHTANQAPDISAMARSSVDFSDVLHGTMVDPDTAEEAFGGYLGGRKSRSAVSRALDALGITDSGAYNQEFMDEILDLTTANAPMETTPAASYASPVSAINDAAAAKKAAIANTAGVHGGIDPTTGGVQIGAPGSTNISSEIAATEAMLPSIPEWSMVRSAQELRGGGGGMFDGPSAGSVDAALSGEGMGLRGPGGTRDGGGDAGGGGDK